MKSVFVWTTADVLGLVLLLGFALLFLFVKVLEWGDKWRTRRSRKREVSR